MRIRLGRILSAVATSNAPCGPYTYLGAGEGLNHESRALGLFKDDDGTAYLMHDDPAGLLRTDRLSADYTTAQQAVASFPEIESGQRWMLSNDGTIVGVQPRRCLDVNGQATANGARVQLWTCNGGANQKWNRG